MAANGVKIENRPLRRSFVVPPEIDEMMRQIQEAQRLANPSEAFRFCVAFTFERLSQPEPTTKDGQLLTLFKKNNALLRYLLIEVIKIHDGNESLSQQGQQYLKKLVQEIKSYHQKQEGNK